MLLSLGLDYGFSDDWLWRLGFLRDDLVFSQNIIPVIVQSYVSGLDVSKGAGSLEKD